MDVDKLLKALDNENNENLMNFTTKKLKDLNKQIIQELSITREKKKRFYNETKGIQVCR